MFKVQVSALLWIGSSLGLHVRESSILVLEMIYFVHLVTVEERLSDDRIKIFIRLLLLIVLDAAR